MPSPAPDKLTIAYVTSRWGEPTQTFVRREAAAALAAGHAVVAVSLKPPQAADPEVPVVHLHPRLAVMLGLKQLIRHPWRCTRAIIRATTGSRPGTLAANLGATLLGIAASARLMPVDWIHAHFNWVAGTAADALATVRGQRYSVFPHAFDIFDHRFIDRYTGDKLRRAALVLVESERIAEDTNELFRCSAIVQRMGVPPVLVVDDATERAGSLVLSVGSLLPKKGHDDLIKAIGSLPHATLRILGDGPQRGELQQLANDLGVADRVELCGAVPAGAVVAHLDEAALFCLASKPTGDGDRDGVPNVLIEAMARGLPVVSTKVSGIPDLLADGRGTVVDPGDVPELVTALTRFLADRAAAVAQAKCALQHVRERYTTEVNWQELEGRIRHVLVSD